MGKKSDSENNMAVCRHAHTAFLILEKEKKLHYLIHKQKVLIYNLSSFWLPVPCSHLKAAGSRKRESGKTCNISKTFVYVDYYFEIFSPLNYCTTILEKLNFEKNL